MFNNILCPIDFTTFSHHALERAVVIARSVGAALTGIHVVDAPGSIADMPRRAWTTEDWASMQAQTLKTLQEVNAPSPRAVVVLGDPAVEIVKLAGAEAIDLIVMPSHGRTGRATGLLGSVTEQVVGHAPTPVVVVPDAPVVRPSTPDGGFRRIACAVDFSPASLRALRYAGDLARGGRAQLVVTYVLPAGEVATTDASVHRSPDAESVTSIWSRRLHAIAHSDLPADVSVEERLRTGDPATEILQLANEERCDLIVIGGHRGNPPGCVMNAVVSQSTCPVLTARVSH